MSHRMQWEGPISNSRRHLPDHDAGWAAGPFRADCRRLQLEPRPSLRYRRDCRQGLLPGRIVQDRLTRCRSGTDHKPTFRVCQEQVAVSYRQDVCAQRASSKAPRTKGMPRLAPPDIDAAVTDPLHRARPYANEVESRSTAQLGLSSGRYTGMRWRWPVPEDDSHRAVELGHFAADDDAVAGSRRSSMVRKITAA